MSTRIERRVRKLCLGLPEATEKESWGSPTFRVRGKIFAMYHHDHHGDGRVALWLKTDPAEQDFLVHADPQQFFLPPYVGPRGWVGVRLDQGIDWDRVIDIVEGAYRRTAPRRLLATLDA